MIMLLSLRLNYVDLYKFNVSNGHSTHHQGLSKALYKKEKSIKDKSNPLHSQGYNQISCYYGNITWSNTYIYLLE